MRQYDTSRYSAIVNSDKPVVDTDIPLELRPTWDAYKNNHFALRRRCLGIFLKFVNKLIIRQRAGERLAKIKSRIEDENVKTREDAERMVIEDWKTA